MTIRESRRGYLEAAVVAVILLLGLGARLVHYDSSPPPAANRDELAWAWAGQSLIEDHSPSSWSFLAAYPKGGTQRTFDGTTMPYVHHWLDHPPLFSMLVGASAILNGERTPEAVTPDVIRWIPIDLSLISLVLLWMLARRLVGTGWALLATALWAFSPWNLQISHVVEAESLLAPMLLGALLLVGRRGNRAGAGLLAICLLAPLVKLVGVAIGVALIPLLVGQRRWRAAAATAVATTVGAGMYGLYGLVIDPSLFPRVLGANAARHGSDVLAGYQFLGSLKAGLGGFVPLHDPFWYAGLLAVGATALVWRDTRYLILSVPVIAYALVLAGTGPDRSGELVYNAGWYRITLYPLLFVALAAIAAELATPSSPVPRPGQPVPPAAPTSARAESAAAGAGGHAVMDP